MKLTFLGLPGAGKGTQSAIVSEKLGIPTIATGRILREAISEGTEVGLEAKTFVESGLLVPDLIIIGILNERLAKSDCKNGFILDGVPRTVAQAVSLEADGILLDAVISLEISDDEILERMTGRRVCPNCGAVYHLRDNPSKMGHHCELCGHILAQRSDDLPETVKVRMEAYHEKTKPLKAFYSQRGLLRQIQANAPIAEVTKAIGHALGIKL
jgi:adenylate kinase